MYFTVVLPCMSDEPQRMQQQTRTEYPKNSKRNGHLVVVSVVSEQREDTGTRPDASGSCQGSCFASTRCSVMVPPNLQASSLASSENATKIYAVFGDSTATLAFGA